MAIHQAKPKEKKTESTVHASPNLKRKMSEVKILSEKIMSAKTVAVIDLKGMPNKIFYKIRKALLGHASIIVAKKAIILHALQECSADRIAELIPDVEGGQPALIISNDTGSISLYSQIMGLKKKVPAGIGKVPETDIMILAGETGLPPGPAIGSLQKAGIPAKIVRGKIMVDKDHLLVKAGTPVTAEAAEALITLGIEPFEVHLNILRSWEDGLIFDKSVLSLTPDLIVGNAVRASSEALALALFVDYVCSDTVEHFIRKAALEARGLARSAGIVNKDTIKDVLASAEFAALAISSIKVGS